MLLNSQDLNLRSLLHSHTHLGRDPLARRAEIEDKCTSAKLDHAMQLVEQETKHISFETPCITTHKIGTPVDEYGTTTVSVYALDTVDRDQIFSAACTAIRTCEYDLPNFSLLRSTISEVTSPATYVQYGVSTSGYANNATGEQVVFESRAISYFRVTDSYALLMWDFVDTDELLPLKPETDMKRDVIGAYVRDAVALGGRTVIHFLLLVVGCWCGRRCARTACSASCAARSAPRSTRSPSRQHRAT